MRVQNPGAKVPAFAVALLLVAITAVYANHFQNGFHFDDAHTIENNAAIRELKNIPRFFSDATTFSSLPSNQSYRPLVSTLLAVSYRLGGGLKPFWFHVSIFALFVTLVLLVAFLIDHLVDNVWIAFGAAALYGLHPANADTVNYIIASSEVIAALGVVASFALYAAFPRGRRYYLYLWPAAIGILAKPPAAIFALLFALYRLLWPEPDQRRPVLRWCADVLPAIAICAAGLWFVDRMTPRTWIPGATSAHDYLVTQPYVAFLYFKAFFWPANLSADYDLNPFSTTDDPRFWPGLAFTAVFIASAATAAVFKKTRVVGFGLLWFSIALLPTSLFPLAEVMNDHRTFVPYIGLAIALAGLGSLLLETAPLRTLFAIRAAAFLLVFFLGATAYATCQRNKVWKDEESLWRDVTIKSPRNGRGLMNFGLTQMAKGDYNTALDYFYRAQVFAPHYSVLFVNLAIAEGALGRTLRAEQDFKEALRLEPSNPDSYTYYARWLLTQSRASDALPLLAKAIELAPNDVLARNLAAQAQTAESYLALSFARYREKRYEEAIDAAKSALALKPDYAGAWNNVCASYNQLGQYQNAVAAFEEALRFEPDLALARNNLEYARAHANASGK